MTPWNAWRSLGAPDRVATLLHSEVAEVVLSEGSRLLWDIADALPGLRGTDGAECVEDLVRGRRRLETWYARVVQGKTIRKGGRPRGPSVDLPELQAQYHIARDRVRRRQQQPTLQAIATELSAIRGDEIPRSTLSTWVERGYLHD